MVPGGIFIGTTMEFDVSHFLRDGIDVICQIWNFCTILYENVFMKNAEFHLEYQSIAIFFDCRIISHLYT